ncbi:hypothetical protein HKD37_02G004421 [Glycine soja]
MKETLKPQKASFHKITNPKALCGFVLLVIEAANQCCSSVPHQRRCLVVLVKLLVLSLKPTVWVSSVNLIMERSSLSYTSKARSRVVCLCNVEAPLVTSWTEDNPGRHFYGCGLFTNIRQKRIIVALMKKVDELKLREKDLQTKISDMKMKGNFLGIGLVFSWELSSSLVEASLVFVKEAKSLVHYTDRQ